MPLEQQPFQLTERSFRRYETAIKTFVSSYPLPTSFNPVPLSPNTYAARLRDALRSLELYKWKTSIDEQKLATIRKEVVIRISKAGNVVVCKKGDDLEEAGKVVQESKQQSSARSMHNLSEAELMAVVLLLHNRRIDSIKLTGTCSATINLAIYGLDVEMIEESDGSIILL